MMAAADKATVKLIWGFLKNTSPVICCTKSLSARSRTKTPKASPRKPAAMVRTVLSLMIWKMMAEGFAPIALLTPISLVRSRTVTIMMLLTPTTPARRVPRPTIQIKRDIPVNNISNCLKILSTLILSRANSSVGDTLWRAFKTAFTWGSRVLMLTFSLATTPIRCTMAPEFWICCITLYGIAITSSSLPLMFTPRTDGSVTPMILKLTLYSLMY